MVFLYLRTALRLMTAFSLAVTTILVVPYGDSQLDTFMTAPENCIGECVLGIRAGVTTVDEALNHLQTHLWVERIELTAPGTGYGQIRWWWSGRQPEFVDASYSGRITFYWDNKENTGQELTEVSVETISIYTRLRMPSLQRQFGIPDSGNAAVRLDGSLNYAADYSVRRGTVSLSAVVPCPANLMSYWNAGTKITMSIGRGTSQYISPTEMVKIC